jgi:uncharacterized membrane protein
VGNFWIHTLEVIGSYSPIHILSVVVIVTAPLAVWYAHTGRVKAHRNAMIQLYFLALIGAGIFTLWPGRLMHEAVFG